MRLDAGSKARPADFSEDTMNELSYLCPRDDSPWGTYLAQIERVEPYLGRFARWVDTLRRPKRALIVDVPIELDDGTVAHF